MNCFTWSKEDNYWIFPGGQYNEQFKNWRGPIHNGQLFSRTLKESIIAEEVCTKYAGSVNFNVIPKEVKPAVPIKYYKDQ